ncbi:methylenetetrahydrofolate reductase [NAD(P)H] [Enterococcus alishanensis]|uniref:Methylenetetrahydrofolate reductase n=1 Tax=Enterococcus alishanensis TaxID=1303817 RepID=A0ABS6T9W8_9ENTE|nr:methylenetetrahydrofolate reductase [NAD(P)H] [Enterococcus alishanensis]MBV7389694.1 methylenetetrahydrofolate reductase [NAD(P)H] [Enterococcus alishanensis]
MTKNKTPSLSFEIFPPKTQIGNQKMLQILNDLQQLSPDFISVTCSNTKGSFESTTIKLADYIQNQLNIPTVTHLPAAYLTKIEVATILDHLNQLNIKNILALRGDILPEEPAKDDFKYASDLIDFIQAKQPDFKISGACYPEIHPDSANRITDIQNLKQKVDAGCNELITQLFFDNELFYDFQEKCQLANINVPILAGIMPIINRNQALRLIKTSEAKLPRKFLAILEKYEHDPIALRDAGIAYAIDQIVDLVTQDSAGIHLYTMNHAETANQIVAATASLFHKQKMIS